MKIICVGGGTLGSVTPLLAVITAWQRENPALLVEWWGTKFGPEKKLLTAYGIKHRTVSSGKWRRYWSWRNLFDIIFIFIGWVQSLWRLGRQRPAIVLTAGGYVAVPPAWAAWCYGIPVAVHQQDVRIGLANKLLAPIASLITVTWPTSLNYFNKNKVVLTGNPVRAEFKRPSSKLIARRELGLLPEEPTLVVVGGGTGAEFLNTLVRNSLAQLTQFCQVVQVTGLGKTGAAENNQKYLSMPLTPDSATLFSAADMVVARAGMGTITELAALSKPAVIIPLPATHQEDNADLLARHQAAVVLSQTSLTADFFIDMVRQLLLSEAAVRLGNNLHKLLSNDAAEKIVAQIIGLLAQPKVK